MPITDYETGPAGYTAGYGHGYQAGHNAGYRMAVKAMASACRELRDDPTALADAVRIYELTAAKLSSPPEDNE